MIILLVAFLGGIATTFDIGSSAKSCVLEYQSDELSIDVVGYGKSEPAARSNARKYCQSLVGGGDNSACFRAKHGECKELPKFHKCHYYNYDLSTYHIGYGYSEDDAYEMAQILCEANSGGSLTYCNQSINPCEIID